MKKRKLVLLSLVLALLLSAGALSAIVFGSGAVSSLPVMEDPAALPAGSYPRMTRLSTGALMVCAGHNEYISFDSGETFTQRTSDLHNNAAASIVTSSGTEHTGMDRANTQAIELSDGSMMVAYRTHTHTPADYQEGDEFYTSIRVMTRSAEDRFFSYDSEEILIERTATVKHGFWEPFLLQLDENTVAMYYADDLTPRTERGCSSWYQDISVMTYDIPTKTWNKTPQICLDGIDHASRDGMPIVARLYDGSGYVLAIEGWIDGGSNLEIELWFSQDGLTNWTNRTIVARSNTKGYNCAVPGVAVLPDGRLAVSFQEPISAVGRTVLNGEVAYNGTPHVVLSSGPVTFANSASLSSATTSGSSVCYRLSSSFSTEVSLPLDYGGYDKAGVVNDTQYSVWNSVYCANGYLYFCGSVGHNEENGGTVRAVSHGVQICRAPVNGAETPDPLDAAQGWEALHITEPDTLLRLMNDPGAWGNTVVLDCDVDLSQATSPLSQTPIGVSSSKAFTGTFDGRGHTLSGLDLETNEATLAGTGLGLFGCVKNASVRDLTVEGEIRSSQSYTGLVGYAIDSELSDLTSRLSITLTGSSLTRSGGVVGRFFVDANAKRECRVARCSFEGTLTGQTVSRAGGVVGLIDFASATSVSATVSDCRNTGTVSGANRIGGVIGAVYNPSSVQGADLIVTRCQNDGPVSAAATSDGFCGGVVGLLQNGAACVGRTAILGSVNTGTVSGVLNAAGIAGGAVSDGALLEIARCRNAGAVSSTRTASLSGTGAIAGKARCVEVRDCEARGSVTGASGVDVGGLIGYAAYNASAQSNAVSLCRNYASLTLSAAGNALSGGAQTGTTVSFADFYLAEGAGASSSAATVLPVTADQAEYHHFDFEAVWTMTENGPTLRDFVGGYAEPLSRGTPESYAVRYVCDAGSDANDGLTSAAPLATLPAAAQQLTGGGVIVVCGPLTVTNASLAANAVYPITITSYYNGADYRAGGNAANDARFIAATSVTAQSGGCCGLRFNGDYTLENLDLVWSGSNPAFILAYHNFRIASSVFSVTADPADAETASKNGILILGMNVSETSAASITRDQTVVLEGDCRYNWFRAGGRNGTQETYSGTMTIRHAYGDVLAPSSSSGTASGAALLGHNNWDGAKIVYDFSGGTIRGNLFVLGYTSALVPSAKASVTVNFLGGRVLGDVVVRQNANYPASLDGTVEINVPDAAPFSRLKTAGTDGVDFCVRAAESWLDRLDFSGAATEGKLCFVTDAASRAASASWLMLARTGTEENVLDLQGFQLRDNGNGAALRAVFRLLGSFTEDYMDYRTVEFGILVKSEKNPIPFRYFPGGGQHGDERNDILPDNNLNHTTGHFKSLNYLCSAQTGSPVVLDYYYDPEESDLVSFATAIRFADEEQIALYARKGYAFCPYAVLRDGEGNLVTLAGGTVSASLYDRAASLHEKPGVSAESAAIAESILRRCQRITPVEELNTASVPGSHAGEEAGQATVEYDYRTYAVQNTGSAGLGVTACYYPRVKRMKDGRYILFYQNGQVSTNMYCATGDTPTSFSGKTIIFRAYATELADGTADSGYFSSGDALVLSNGDILAVTALRINHDYTKNVAGGGLVLSRSTDNGKTWSKARLIYTGNCWEPHLIELPGGEVQVYFTHIAPKWYADTYRSERRSSGVGLIRSYDGGESWTPYVAEPPYAAERVMQQYITTLYGVRHFTDQMPVACLLADGTLAVAAESKQADNSTFKISLGYSDDNWATGLGIDETGPADRLDNFVTGAGPYLVAFPSGETLLSYNRSNTMIVRTGDAGARAFGGESTVFGTSGFWGSLLVDGTHSAVAAFPSVSGSTSAIRTVTLRLNHALFAQEASPAIDGYIADWLSNTDAVFLGAKTQAQVTVRTAYDAENACFLAERSDSALRSSDTVTLYLPAAGGGIYTLTLDPSGTATLKKDGSPVSFPGACAVFADGTFDDPSDEDGGVLWEVSFPRALLNDLGGVLRFTYTFTAEDENGSTVTETPVGVVLNEANSPTWFKTYFGETEPETPAADAVFVDGQNGSDANDGLTASSAVATYERAFSLLTPSRSTVVVVHTVPAAADYVFPAYDGTVTLTARQGSFDYAKNNNAGIRVLSSCAFSSDVILDGIRLLAESDGARICARFHNVTVTDTVVSAGALPSFVGGYLVSDVALNVEGHMTAAEVSHTGNLVFSISGGKWRSIVGGNVRLGKNAPVGTVNGALTLTLGGSVEVESGAITDDIGVDYIAASGANIAHGSVTLEITGGTYKTPVYAIGHLGKYFNFTAANGKTGTDGLQQSYDTLYNAGVTVLISGGDFTSPKATEIKALQVPGETALHADCAFTVAGGSFSDTLAFSALGVLGNTTAAGVPAGHKTVDFLFVNGSRTAEKHVPRLACCGDSITFGTGFTAQDGYLDVNFSYPAQLQRLCGDTAVVGNFGYPGSNVTSGSYAKYYQSLCWNLLEDFDPDFVLFALGTNNASLMPGGLADFKNSYIAMIGALREAYPQVKVFMTTALYRFDNADRNEMVDSYIIPAQKEIAGRFFGFTRLVDLNTLFRPYGSTTYYKDKLHPNNLGYSKLAEILFDTLDLTGASFPSFPPMEVGDGMDVDAAELDGWDDTLLATGTASPAPVYENGFSDPDALSSLRVLYGGFEVREGALCASSSLSSGQSTLLFPTDTLDDFIAECDFLGHIRGGGLIIRSDGERASASGDTAFYGYHAFIGNAGTLGALGCAGSAGTWSGNLFVSAADVTEVGSDLHLRVLAVGNVLVYTVTDKTTGKEVFRSVYRIGDHPNDTISALSGLVGFRMVNDGGVGRVDNVSVRPLKSTSDAFDLPDGKAFSASVTLASQETLTLLDGEGNGLFVCFDPETDLILFFRRENGVLSRAAEQAMTLTEGREYPFGVSRSDGICRIFFGYADYPVFETVCAAGPMTLASSFAFVSKLTDAPAAAAETYLNPVASGPDPDVYFEDGVYYLYTHQNGAVQAQTSVDLIHWSAMQPVYTVDHSVTDITAYMSPNVFKSGDTYYLLIASKTRNLSEYRIRYATAASPLGPFTMASEDSFVNDVQEIGGAPFIDEDGKIYLTTVRFGGGNHVYIQEIRAENGVITPLTPGTLVVSPTEHYECDGYGKIAEGGVIVKHNGLYYMLYASGHYKGHYGEACAVSESICGPYTKVGYNEVLPYTDEADGVGDCVFVSSPDGSELFVMYHRHAVIGNEGASRVICIDRVVFEPDENGGPDILRIVGPTNTPQPVPSHN
ncbi:MAG: family 43 glycosylhydrolase [Clostridia bacterium]|nr:family 43 glycosylhydrolase [Clostridia bacterium]